MNLQLEIESLQSDIRKLETLRDRVHSLEVKLGNLNAVKELGRLVQKVAQLEDFQDVVENWMRRVESLLKEVEQD